MPCNPCQAAWPLVLCTEDDAVIYVGTVTTPVTHVRLKSLATGRLIQYEADSDSDGVFFTYDGNVIPGHLYEVAVLNNAVQVDYRPYVINGYEAVASATAYECVTVEFEKVEGFEAGDQFLTLVA